MGNSVDIVLIRQRRRRRRRMSKFLLMLLAVGICIFVYAKRDVWFPRLEGIGSKYQNITQNENADTEGNYPLSVSGGVDYYTSFVGNTMFILCDMYVYIYSSDGNFKESRQHAYSNAIMETNDSRCLLYSCNGTKFRVDSASKMIYEITTERPILFARIGDNGNVAVVTESDTYACRLTVYDSTGNRLYNRECVDRLLDVSLNKTGCIFATLGAENGDLVTTLQSVTFNNETQWISAPLATLCMKVYALENGDASVIGDTRCAYYNSMGDMQNVVDFSGPLADYAFTKEHAAILLENEERRQSQLLLFAAPGDNPSVIQIPYIAKSVDADNETAFLLGTQSIESYAFTGEHRAQLKITDSYENLMKNGKYFYLLGYDKINRINMR
jgi:hypothetical protein